jgi:hypothetical protein
MDEPGGRDSYIGGSTVFTQDEIELRGVEPRVKTDHAGRITVVVPWAKVSDNTEQSWVCQTCRSIVVPNEPHGHR